MNELFRKFAHTVSAIVGTSWVFITAVMVVCVWAATGHMFHYSDTWQLVINTGTTIITFLMVFLIQSTQNRDGAAIQTKLDELIRASAAQNRYIGIEDLSEEELLQLRQRCISRAKADRLAKANAAAAGAETGANRRARRAADEASGVA